MITKLTQTRLHDEETQGNCWEACIHSLLGDSSIELDLRGTAAEDSWENHWLIRTNEYLATRGWTVVLVEAERPVYITSPDLIYIADGPSPRGPFMHAVLHKNGELWHDPHPSGAGLVEVRGYSFLVPLPS